MGERVRLFVPKQAVGANLVYFDVFNAATSGIIVNLLRLEPIASGAAAHTGVLSVDLHLTATTAVGTGGTAMTVNGTALDAMTITGQSTKYGAVPPGITGRLTPSGGGTAGKSYAWTTIFTEETGAGTYARGNDMVHMETFGPIIITPGFGFRVVQGAIAATGNIGFNADLEFVPAS